MTSWYLGLSTSGHDPALAIVSPQGQVVFAEATERFLQDKRAWGIVPDHAPHLESALVQVGFDPAQDRLVVATSWAAIKSRMQVQVHDTLMRGTDTRWLIGLQSRLQQDAGASLLRLGLSQTMPEVLRFDHHTCHAVCAAYFAPDASADSLVIDGEGDVGAVSCFRLTDRRLRRKWRSWGPGSLGTFYGWLTGVCGFDWRLGEEWKVMGLAAYGQPDPDLVADLARLLVVDRGRVRFADPEVIAAAQARVAPLARTPADPIDAAALLAASGQQAYALLADQILSDIRTPGEEALILSGGCALNSSYNGTIAGRTGYVRVHVPPCPADDGNAIGAALLAWMQETGTDSIPYGGGSPFLGSRPKPATIEKSILAAAAGMEVTDVAGRSADAVTDCLIRGEIIGVMLGAAEFGPRALGNRSILADPRAPEMKERINARIKGREAYRPFAPVIPETRLSEWFTGAMASPYMSMTLPWRAAQQAKVPAVVHADGTGRAQSVSLEISPWMHALVTGFGNKTGVPVVLNTSFNIMGKPIVHSVEDALAVLMTSGLDGVLLENALIRKPPLA